MFSSSPKEAIKAYSKVSVETGVLAADPHQLIVMLFDGAIKAIVEAGIQMKANNVAEKGRLITQAILIIESGLRASLNKKVGGQLALNLDALYGFLSKELILANLDNNEEQLAKVNKSLMELRSAWLQIAPAKVKANQSEQEEQLEPAKPTAAATAAKAVAS